MLSAFGPDEFGQALLRTSSSIIVALDGNGKILIFNEGAEKATGFKAEEVLGKSWFSALIPKDARESLQKAFAHVLSRKKRMAVYENQILTKSGHRILVRWHNTLITDDGGVKMTISIGEDVTERRSAQEALRESEERFRNMYEAGNVGISLVGLDLGFIRANPALCRIVGYSENELRRMSYTDLTPSEDVGRDRGMGMKLGRGEADSYKVEKRYIRKDGRIVWVSINVSTIHDDNGKPKYFVVLTEDITERKKAEMALLSSEKYFSAIFDNAPDVIAHLDRGGTIVRINKVVRERWGYRSDQIIGKNIVELKKIFPPKSIAILLRNLKKRFAGSHVGLYTVEARAANGCQMFIEVRGSLVWQDGDFLGDVVILREVTEKKKSAEQLAESEERFRKIVESSHDLVMLTKTDGRIAYLSPACFKVIGWRPEALVGKKASVVHPEDRIKTREALRRATTGKSGKDFEYRILTQDGKTKWVSHSWSPIMVHKKVQLVASVVSDITERKKSEMEIRDSRRRLSDLVDFLPDATFVTDSRGRITIWNKAMESMSGLSAQRMLGKPVSAVGWHFYGFRRPVAAELLLEPESEIEKGYDSVVRQKDMLIAKGIVPNLRGKGKKGYAWMLAKPLYDSSGNFSGVIESVRDISDLKQAEQGLREEKEKVEELSSLKERFMADITHELKTPLSVIMLNLDMVRRLDTSRNKKDYAQCYDVMLRNSNRIARSLDSIMELSNMESVEVSRSRMRIKRLVHDAVDEFMPITEAKGIGLTYSGPELDVLSDPKLVRIALDHLLSNAVKFTDKGSVLVSWKVSGSDIVISVKDTGRGISKENQRKVFEKFFKEDPNAPGSGIGLNLVSSLMKKIGVKLDFESVKGRGSVFRILIPNRGGRT